MPSGRATGTIIMMILGIIGGGCSNKPSPPVEPVPANVTLIASYPLEVPEPSGLTMDLSGENLWCVSDRDNRIYRLTPVGAIAGILPWEGSDLEGIAWDPRDGGSLWVVEEGTQELVHLSLAGEELDRHTVAIEPQGSSGLEGVVVDPNGDRILVLNEKDEMVIAELDGDYAITASWSPDVSLDLSGIARGPVDGEFWIVSDQSQLLWHWSPETGPGDLFELDFPKLEGVARGPDGLIYLVSDSEETMYVYRWSEGSP